MGSYVSLLFFIITSRSLSVFMGPYVSIWVFIGPYRSL